MNDTQEAERLTLDEAVARLDRANAEIARLRAEATKQEGGNLEDHRAFCKRRAEEHRIFMEEMDAARPRRERIIERSAFVVCALVATLVGGVAGWVVVHLLIRFYT